MQPAHEVQGVVAQIAEVLGEHDERPLGQITALAETLGVYQVLGLLERAQTIEADGGMTLPDGRRRTLGGVFFYLARRTLPAADKERIFPHAPSVFDARKQTPPRSSRRPRIIDTEELLAAARPAWPAQKTFVREDTAPRYRPERPVYPPAIADPVRSSPSTVPPEPDDAAKLEAFVLAQPADLAVYRIVGLARDAGMRVTAAEVRLIREQSTPASTAPIAAQQPVQAAAPRSTRREPALFEAQKLVPVHEPEPAEKQKRGRAKRASSPAKASPPSDPGVSSLTETGSFALGVVKSLLAQLEPKERKAVITELAQTE